MSVAPAFVAVAPSGLVDELLLPDPLLTFTGWLEPVLISEVCALVLEVGPALPTVAPPRLLDGLLLPEPPLAFSAVGVLVLPPEVPALLSVGASEQATIKVRMLVIPVLG
ncbi:hypothetical protein ACFL5O_05755 [Myxococcota bacterium]